MAIRYSVVLLVLIIGNNSLFAGEERLSNLNLGIIVNNNDPTSIEIGKYYAQRRAIPEDNIIYVNFKSSGDVMSVNDFTKIKKIIDAQSLQNDLQGLAVAWTKPFRVDCMSLTSAITLGFDKVYCAKGCKPTKVMDYYNSDSNRPFEDFKIRPSMMLAGGSILDVKNTIETGISSDDTHPKGTAYLLSTSDINRNVRSQWFNKIYALLSSRFNIKILKKDILLSKKDVMFYFTGVSRVKDINTNQFLPGAVADHLTSAGGLLRKLNEIKKEKLLRKNNFQMSILRWLEAGATASYGTVVEPCNFLTKFPYPLVMMHHYLQGDTVVEAYWKSVRMPGQGVFVGEPLARPFAK